MLYDEERMIKLCQELGIPVVDRDCYPTFFEDERKVRLSELLEEPLVIKAEEKSEFFEIKQELFLQDYMSDTEVNDLSEYVNKNNISDEVIIHSKSFMNVKDSMYEKSNLIEQSKYAA